MGVGGSAGSTNVNVPPEIGQIGQATTGLAQEQQAFLGEGLSLGNYGIALATGGQGAQVTGAGAAQYNLTTGGLEPVAPPADTGMGGTAAGTPGAGGATGPPQQFSQPGGGQITLVPVGSGYYQKPDETGQGFPYYQPYDSGQGWQGVKQVQPPSLPSGAPSTGQGGTLTAEQAAAQAANRPGQMQYPSTIQIGGQGGATLASGQFLSPQQLQAFMTSSPYQQTLLANQYGTSVQDIQAKALQVQATGGTGGGITVPGENPLYGPWINMAVSAMQNEGQQAQDLQQMIGLSGQREQTYYGQSQATLGQANQAYQTGTSMLQQATTGTGLYPSQQALVDAAVRSGQSQVAQQLASEGLSASTLGPELSAEIGLQGAATAGGLIQGNIQVAEAEQGIGVNLQQAAQGWAQLAQGEQTIGFGEQQALTNLFSTIAAQGSSMQNQFWQQGIQGYGLEGAFFSQTLQAYGTSLQAYNSILQASEVQAQVNASIENANTAANAAIIGDVIQGVSSIASSAVKGFCWVARAVFGEQNPRWLLFRSWLVHRAPKWLLRLYVRNGPRWADWISDKPICKRVVRFLMNLAIDYGG